MTGPEWADAFDKASPKNVGQAIHAALVQAGQEAGMGTDPPWSDMTPTWQQQYIRAGEILIEHGLTIPGVK